MVFYLICILVDRPMGEGAIAPPLPRLLPGYATAGTALYYGKSGLN